MLSVAEREADIKAGAQCRDRTEGGVEGGHHLPVLPKHGGEDAKTHPRQGGSPGFPLLTTEIFATDRPRDSRKTNAFSHAHTDDPKQAPMDSSKLMLIQMTLIFFFLKKVHNTKPKVMNPGKELVGREVC